MDQSQKIYFESKCNETKRASEIPALEVRFRRLMKSTYQKLLGRTRSRDLSDSCP